MENLEEKIEEFLRKNEPDLIRACEEGKPLVIDFGKLDRFNPLIADRLIESPEEIIGMFERAIDNIDLPEHEKIRVRIKNLPKHRSIRIRDLRAKHLNKLYEIVGIVRSASEIRPQIYEAVFKCPECGNMITVEQSGPVLRTPLACECGRRGIFKLVETKKYDIRWLNVNEPYEITSGEQPGKIDILLKEDLTTPEMQRKTDPGNQLRITGILKEIPKRIAGKLSTRPGIFFEANYVEPKEEEFEEMKITEEDKKKIEEMAKDPYIYDRLVASIAPGIYGLSEIKEAILLQLFGGIKHEFEDGTYVRGNIHILLTGDPSTAKSVLISNVVKTLPRGRYVSGKGVTGAGLCTVYDTLIMLEDGSLLPIGKVVERELKKGYKEIRHGVFISTSKSDKKVLSFDSNSLKIKPLRITKYWKLKAPKKLVKIVTRTGKEIKVTMENPIPVIRNSKIIWVPANELKYNDFLVTARKLTVNATEKNNSLIDIIDKDAWLLNKSEIVEKLLTTMKSKTTIKEFCKKSNMDADDLYQWRFGNCPTLSEIQLVSDNLGLSFCDVIPDEVVLSQHHGHKIRLPLALTRDMAYLIGLLAGDGNISKTEYDGFVIRFNNSSEELLKRFASICEKEMKIKPKYLKQKNRVAYMRFSSKIFAKILSEFGVVGKNKSHNLYVTEKLSKLPNDILASYLTGVFDTDGYVIRNKSIGLTSASKKFIESIQILLLRFGIISRIRKRNPTTSVIRDRIVKSGNKYELEISGLDNLKIFERFIGFNFSKKREMLSQTIKNISRPDSNIDVLPIGELLRYIRARLNLSAKELYGYKCYSYEKGRRKPTVKLLRKIEEKIKHAGIKVPEELSRFINSDIFFDKIKKIEIIENKEHEYVYDITVENEHSFVANGLIIHNTSTVTKNELLGGWILEAGALILSNKSILAIDEFDKMNRDDMIAMHEAMSLESYHKDTIITLANGEQRKIGNMVEEIFRKNKDKIRKGADCFYVDIKDGTAVLTTDFKNIYKKTVFRVSKHKAPEYFYKIILENGKEIVVTPNHPCFCFENGRFAEKPVNELRRNDFVPIPRIMPITGEEQKLNIDDYEQFTDYNPKMNDYTPKSGASFPIENALTSDKSEDIIHNLKMKESGIRAKSYDAKHIQIPTHNSPELCRWIGYMVSEGSHELNRGKINGISFTNSDQYLLNDFRSITKKLFGLSPYIQKKEGRTMLRYISVELKNFVSSLEPALLKNSYLKRLPPFVFKCRTDEIRHLLRALFDGDGSLVAEKNSVYITYTTTSKELANQIYDLLLRFGIVSRIASVEKASKRRVYRVVITGSENLSNFLLIGFSNANKNKKISKFLGSKLHRTTYAERIPAGKNIANVLRLLKLPQKQIVGYNITYHEGGKFNFSRDKVKEILNKIDKRMAEISEARKIIESADSIKKIRELRIKLNVSTIDMAKCIGCCHQLISLREIHRPTREFFEKYKKAFKRYLDGVIRKAEDELCDIRKLAFGDIVLCKIRRVEKIKNRKEKWVYDISVPNKIFLSNGMVLHNTISVAKASIVATLPAETAILAAANPKLGRFDTYAPIIDQVMIPETLLSRFDLKFALRDIPDRERDAEMVDHVTKTRLSPEVAKPLIDLHMLRKYISYARKTCTDIKLTEEAANMLKKFYVDLRNKYAGEATPTVTITLRQFEALIRLAEASAKVRMDKYVRKEDAERAIKLMTFSIQQLGTEIETGKIDIDRMESGITSSQRSKIKIILDIMSELESKIGKNIPIEDVKAAAEEQGIENADEMLEKLDREGLIFHPKPGHVRKA